MSSRLPARASVRIYLRPVLAERFRWNCHPTCTLKNYAGPPLCFAENGVLPKVRGHSSGNTQGESFGGSLFCATETFGEKRSHEPGIVDSTFFDESDALILPAFPSLRSGRRRYNRHSGNCVSCELLATSCASKPANSFVCEYE